jgi:hypothetical protein
MNRPPPKASTRLRLRVDRREISFFKFVLEAYEGVAILSTIDPHLGTVELMIGPGCESHVDQIIRDLSEHIRIEAVPNAP